MTLTDVHLFYKSCETDIVCFSTNLTTYSEQNATMVLKLT